MVASAQGLDASNFQGRFNWGATSGMSFGICRATQGLGAGVNSPDPELAWNFAAIKAKGLIRGAYHFLDSRIDGTAQAEYFVRTLAAHGLNDADMLWLDNEAAGTSPRAVSGCANAFMTELHKLAPHNPMGVYTFRNFAQTGNCAGLGGWPLWMAAPASAAPPAPEPWNHWTFWQYGLRDATDADAYNGTEAQLHTWIASHAPKPPAPGPHRHLAGGHQSLTGAAVYRGTTWEVAITTSRAHLNAENLKKFNHYVGGGINASNIPHNVAQDMPKGLVYWTP